MEQYARLLRNSVDGHYERR
jgi:hypothetical protein